MILSLVPLEQRLLQEIHSKTGETVQTADASTEAGLLAQAEIVLAPANFSVNKLDAAKKLRWLFIPSAGVEHLPFQALEERGVTLTNVSGIHGTQMAEQAIGCMIAFSRRLMESIRNQQQGVWGKNLRLSELSGKTLVIVGAGSIGQETARKAKAFDMKVIGLKKHPQMLEHFDEVRGMDRFQETLAEGDYVLLLTPLTKETYHLFGEPEFAKMKDSSVFLNLSRGDTVDEAALIAALQNGTIAGAALDVFHNEPLEAESPLWKLPNVLMTPHMAGTVPDYFDRAVANFLTNYEAYKAGRPLPGAVDLHSQY